MSYEQGPDTFHIMGNIRLGKTVSNTPINSQQNVALHSLEVSKRLPDPQVGQTLPRNLCL